MLDHQSETASLLNKNAASSPPKRAFALTLILALTAATALVNLVPASNGAGKDDEIPCNKCGNGSLAAPRPAPSLENLQMLHNANALDIALYAFAAERFEAHFDACFRGR